ncbi:PFD1 [Symbiodinium pilosum]|uniref:PFD1 protein n=1 Tax=Symbiodinium pilosum TaxID=2952 RepID=A0A812YK83_SYMPI|nr:PFD1 [Symbiodinium pilosum]
MKQVEGKIKHCMMEAKRAELTEKELQPMPEDLKVYRQVGKMFILQPKPDLARSLKAQVAVKTLESQQLKQAYNKIQEKVRSEADGLKELIGPERTKQLFQSGGHIWQ